jgi:hypothetical protein
MNRRRWLGFTIVIASCGGTPAASPDSLADVPAVSTTESIGTSVATVTDSTVPSSTTPVPSVARDPTTQPATSTTLPWLEQYDVQPRVVEVGGSIVLSGVCDIGPIADYRLEASNGLTGYDAGGLRLPLESQTVRADGYHTFEYSLTLSTLIGPGELTVTPECVGVDIDYAPGQRPISSDVPGYEPFVVEVVERAEGPRWASYKPLEWSVTPTVLPAPGGVVTVSATCAADAVPGLARVLSYQQGIAEPTASEITQITVPVDAFTVGDVNRFTLEVPVEGPNPTLGVLCTMGVDGGLMPFESVFVVIAPST